MSEPTVTLPRSMVEKVRAALTKYALLRVGNVRDGDYVECRLCGAETLIGGSPVIQHTPDCLITILDAALAQPGAVDWRAQHDKVAAAGRANIEALWAALRMIREAVEQHVPMPSSESMLLQGPEPHYEAEALIVAIGHIAALAQPGDAERNADWGRHLVRPEIEAREALPARLRDACASGEPVDRALVLAAADALDADAQLADDLIELAAPAASDTTWQGALYQKHPTLAEISPLDRIKAIEQAGWAVATQQAVTEIATHALRALLAMATSKGTRSASDTPAPAKKYPDNGACGMRAGDRVVHTLTGKHGIVDNFLSDGEADISFDDSTFATVKWNHLRPAPADTRDAVVNAAREMLRIADWSDDARFRAFAWPLRDELRTALAAHDRSAKP